MKYSFKKIAMIMFFLAMLSPLLLMATDITVKLDFEPEEIYLNQKTYLKFVVEGSQATPKIDFRNLPTGLRAENITASA